VSADNWADCPQCGKSETLREHYEIGIWHGNFDVSYSAKCYYGRKEGCGFEFRYTHSNPVGAPTSGEKHS